MLISLAIHSANSLLSQRCAATAVASTRIALRYAMKWRLGWIRNNTRFLLVYECRLQTAAFDRLVSDIGLLIAISKGFLSVCHCCWSAITGRDYYFASCIPRVWHSRPHTMHSQHYTEANQCRPIVLVNRGDSNLYVTESHVIKSREWSSYHNHDRNKNALTLTVTGTDCEKKLSRLMSDFGVINTTDDDCELQVSTVALR